MAVVRRARGRVSVEALLREMPNGFGRAPLDLRLHLRRRRGFVHEDAEFVVVGEEATGKTVAIFLERDGLDGEVERVPPHRHTNEAEQATRDLGDVLGSVLHVREAKHGASVRKPRERSRKSQGRAVAYQSPTRQVQHGALVVRAASPRFPNQHVQHVAKRRG